MDYYFDTSALLKRYFREAGAPVVDELLAGNAQSVTSVITYAESYAARARLTREGRLSPVERERSASAIEADWIRMTPIDFNEEVRRFTARLSETSMLKGADLIHLVTAFHLHSLGYALKFVSSDTRLLREAARCGLVTLDPTNEHA